MDFGEKCIYCSKATGPRGQGDHIVPTLLGEFRNDKHFLLICRECNYRIGQAEQQLTQSGPEGYFRQIVKPQSKRGRRRGHGPPRGAMGAPRPVHTVDMGDHRAMVTLSKDDPHAVSPVDQLVVRTTDETDHHIPLYKGMRLGQLQNAIAKIGSCGIREARLRCDEDGWPGYASLLQEMWPDAKVEECDPTPSGMHPAVPGRVKFMLNDNYFRAICKIAFHYYLVHSNCGHRGDEDCFKSIRDFILRGGDHRPFFDPPDRPAFIFPFGERSSGAIATPVQWCHVLAASEINGHAFAYVQLFVGPGCITAPHCVSLGRWKNPDITSRSIWGHVYLYDHPQKPTNFCGEVKTLAVTCAPATH